MMGRNGEHDGWMDAFKVSNNDVIIFIGDEDSL
jgi:hypothetical protein